MTKYCKVVVVCFFRLVCHNCIACIFFYRGFCYCFVNGFRFTAVPASFTISLTVPMWCFVTYEVFFGFCWL